MWNKLSRCPLCGVGKYISSPSPSRESDECDFCKSIWRTRAIGQAVVIATDKGVSPLHQITPDLSIRGLGIGDSVDLSNALSTKYRYTNSHLDEYPFLDLTERVPDKIRNYFDFITCSEILEHVVPPVENAIQNLFDMLRPEGAAIISVPLIKVGSSGRYEYSGNTTDIHFGEEILEYYPGLKSFNLTDGELSWSNGSENFIDSNPELHGGTGLVLTFRRWSSESLKSSLREVGFRYIFEPSDIHVEGDFKLVDAGIIIAKK